MRSGTVVRKEEVRANQQMGTFPDNRGIYRHLGEREVSGHIGGRYSSLISKLGLAQWS